MVERVEVIRGPSAAIYGSSAFFAVINVVTKKGNDAEGAQLAASASTFGAYAGRVSYGHAKENGLDLLLSASYAEADGPRRLYFAEFDDPATNNGMVERADDEGHRKLLASASKGPFSLNAAHTFREKRVPTGSYGTLFNDPRLRTSDQLTLTSLGYSRPNANGTSIAAKVHVGQYHYHGAYPYDASTPANQDDARGEWWGLDLDAARSLFRRHLLSVGLEYRDNYRQDQHNYDPEPYAVWIDEQRNSRRLGAFAQDELKLLDALTLYLGVRVDWYDTFGRATSPRVGLIYLPDEATTIKMLFGRAFRAPNEYELHYGGLGLYKTNPSLQPEKIETLELVGERVLGRTLRASVAGFRNRISDLITLTQDPADDLFVFRNAEAIDSDGLEVALDANRGRGVSGRLSYALQRSRDHESGIVLTNSPRHMAKFQLGAPLPINGISAGLTTYYMSSRRTLAGHKADGHAVTNFTLRTPKPLGRLVISASVYNLFDVRYGDPGSEEHSQDIIEQNGRTFRVKASVQF
jgi:outer membrane receptor for ferrienterochelin and colicins